MSIKPEIRARIVGAANALLDQGIQNPTNDQVREQMGGGSLSHISPVMRQWRQERKQAEISAQAVPAELKKDVDAVASRIWFAASRLAQARNEQLKEEAEAKVGAAEGERDEALQEVGRLEGQLADLLNQVREKDAQIAGL